MPIDLYHMHASSPCRAVRLVAAKIGLELNLKFVNIAKKDQFKPEFLKMNPQHSIPTIDDNGFYLSESYAICTYLIDQYAKDDSLYPKDPKKRAIVNQRLYFDHGHLYRSLFDYYIAPGRMGARKDLADLLKLGEAFELLEQFLEGQNYVAGDKLNVADIILFTSVSNVYAVDHEITQYKNVCRWFDRVKCEISEYEEINAENLRIYKGLTQKLIDKEISLKTHTK